MSMQSVCLEGLGGEKEVDPRLQDTTLIQQIFGGRLKSKVTDFDFAAKSFCLLSTIFLLLIVKDI